MIISGAVLTYFGNRYLKRLKQSATFALQMIRTDGKIDARELSQQMQLSEVDIREYIAES
jgi:hypothetical protein